MVALLLAPPAVWMAAALVMDAVMMGGQRWGLVMVLGVVL